MAGGKRIRKEGGGNRGRTDSKKRKREDLAKKKRVPIFGKKKAKPEELVLKKKGGLDRSGKASGRRQCRGEGKTSSRGGGLVAKERRKKLIPQHDARESEEKNRYRTEKKKRKLKITHKKEVLIHLGGYPTRSQVARFFGGRGKNFWGHQISTMWGEEGP